MERVKLDNKRILFNLLPAHVAQHFLMSNPRNMVNKSYIFLWYFIIPTPIKSLKVFYTYYDAVRQNNKKITIYFLFYVSD